MLLAPLMWRTHFRKLSFQRATKVNVQQMNTQATMMSTAQPSLPRLQNRWRTLAWQMDQVLQAEMQAGGQPGRPLHRQSRDRGRFAGRDKLDGAKGHEAHWQPKHEQVMQNTLPSLHVVKQAQVTQRRGHKLRLTGSQR